MKKLFVLSCVALATLASCSKSEDIEAPQAQKEIAFNVATDKSRAPIEGTSFNDDQKIYVSAYNSVSGKYFSGVEFSKAGTTWKAGKYWPVNGVTSFLAYAATSDVTSFNPTWGAKYADNVEFDIASGFYKSETGTTTPYIDLLYASGEQAKEKEYDPVSMTFKHTGAWVVFNVKLAPGLTGATVTLNTFQLANLFNGGKVVVDNTTYAGAKASWDFSRTTAADYDVQSFTASTELSTTDYTFGAIIPEQNQTAIKFNYTLSSTGAAFDAQTVDFEYPLSRFNKWEMGKKYVYNITITFKEIEIEPVVKDWGTPTDTAIGI